MNSMIFKIAFIYYVNLFFTKLNFSIEMKFTKIVLAGLMMMPFLNPVFAQQSRSKNIENRDFSNSKLYKSKARILNSDMQKLDSLVIKRPDANGVLQNYSKSFFEYNIDGTLKSSVERLWDASTSSWVLDERWVLIYDQGELPTSLVLYYWDASTSSWELSGRELRSYNEEGLLTESVFSNWDSNLGNWNSDYRVLYTYNSFNDLLTITDFVFNTSSQTWDSFSIWEYEYTDGLVSSRTLSLFSGVQKNLQQKVEYLYDQNDLLTTTNTYIWIGTWQLDSRNTYAYNSENQLLEEIHYVNLDVLTPETKLVYNYPFNVEIESLILPDFLFGFNNSPNQQVLANTDEFQYNTTTMQWDLVNASMVYFSEFEGSITAYKPVESTDFQFKIYPNPASEYVFINSTTPVEQDLIIEILDVNGNIVVNSRTLELPGLIELNKLQKGIYIIKLINNGQSNTQKIVLQ
jgi:hypothetical protein